MTKNWKSSISGVLALALLPGLAHAGTGLTGNWVRDNGTVRIAVTPCGDSFCAVNTWVKRTDGNEKIGDKLVLTVKPVSGSELQGQAYDVRRQRTYKMTITLHGNSMETSGCVLLGIICKRTGWTRAG